MKEKEQFLKSLTTHSFHNTFGKHQKQLITSNYVHTIITNHSAAVGLQLTVWRRKEVEEWVVLHSLHDRSLRSSALVLLNFLDNFDRHVLAFLPVDCASNETPFRQVPLQIMQTLQAYCLNHMGKCLMTKKTYITKHPESSPLYSVKKTPACGRNYYLVKSTILLKGTHHSAILSICSNTRPSWHKSIAKLLYPATKLYLTKSTIFQTAEQWLTIICYKRSSMFGVLITIPHFSKVLREVSWFLAFLWYPRKLVEWGYRKILSNPANMQGRYYGPYKMEKVN